MGADVCAVLRPIVAECGKQTGLGLYHFDGRGIAQRFREAAVIAALAALRPGETMRFYDELDPLPLLVHIARHFGTRVTPRFVCRNPCEAIIDFQIVS